MFWKFILRALKYRKQRLLLAFAALAVGAALATVLFGIYGTVADRLRDQFRSYGANLAAFPVIGATVPLEVVNAANRAGAEAAPFLITSGQIDSETVAVAAFVPSETAAMTPYWHMQGTRNIGRRECLAGELLARRLQLRIGSTVPLAGAPCTLRGIVSTGGAEDSELLIPLTGESAAGFVEIRAPGDRLEAVRSALSAQFPNVDFRAVRAVATTETSVVLKIRASLFLLTLIILAITTLCVSGNFTEMVIERAKEIAILKALGAAERKIAAFFVSESAALAIAATLTGYIAGIFAAAAIVREIFGGGFHLQGDWLVFGSVMLVMMVVATVATATAASRIWSIDPAIILRGE